MRTVLRLASLEADGWQLRSGEAQHAESPDTFWTPDAEARQGLRVGQAAKLIFDIEVLNKAGAIEVSAERMWVMVGERVAGHYVGILDNKPASFDPADDIYLAIGAEIPFGPEHVIDIDDRPDDYARWQLGQAPERCWPRGER